MKSPLLSIVLPSLGCLCSIFVCTGTLLAQGTAFTYQGRLNDGANPATGTYDLRFTIYDALAGGSVSGGPTTNSATGVTNGLFTVSLDFGVGVFTGGGRWLEIAVRTNGAGGFTPLLPRQALASTPYAITAGNVVSGGLAPGAYASAVSFGNPANSFSGSFAGNGANVTNVNATALGGLASSNFWQLGGNSGTVAGSQFLGTADNQPLELRVNGRRALRLEPAPDAQYVTNTINVIAGSPVNTVAPGIHAATIAGGGMETDGYTAYPNSVTADFATVGGGLLNTASGGGAIVAGGLNNIGAATVSTVSGGSGNWSYAAYGTIGGGNANIIWGGNSDSSTIGGGENNQIQGYQATIPGGVNNFATNNSFAAGVNAKAYHPGAFVWADRSGLDFASTGTNQFLIRAIGGVGINTNNPAGAALNVNGTVTATGFSGSGAGLTGLNAAQISGTLPSAALSGTYSSVVTFNNAANSFTGNGSGLSSLNAASLSGAVPSAALTVVPAANLTGAVPPATLTSVPAGNLTGSIADARLSANVALLTGSQTFSGAKTFGGEIAATSGVRINNTNLWFKGDANHGLGWYGNGKPFAGASNTIDGPVLFGYTGGALGTSQFGTEHIAVLWSATSVTVNGTFNNNSDRNSKERFAPVSPADILLRVAQLPVSEWSYQADAATRHIGPMAQDFYAAFSVGTDERHIAPIDEGGVALAAIQGLNDKIEVRSQKSEVRARMLEQRLEQKETEITELKQRLDALEQLIRSQKPN
jgi:hypothetical protein